MLKETRSPSQPRKLGTLVEKPKEWYYDQSKNLWLKSHGGYPVRQ